MKTLAASLILFCFTLATQAADDAASLHEKGLQALKDTDAPHALVKAVQFLTRAKALYETAGDLEKIVEINSYLYWCRKKMTLQDIEEFNRLGESAVVEKLSALERSAPNVTEAQAWLDRAEKFAKINPLEHLLNSIRFFEVADRFKGTDASLVAQDRSLKELLAAQTSLKQSADGWSNLFNGKDLTGWDGDPAIWRVEEGCIVGKAAKIERNTFLIHRQPYANFILRAKWKMTKAGSYPNSGIQFRSTVADAKSWTVGGYQMDMCDGHWGDLHEELGRSQLAPGSAAAARAVKQDDWNEYEIKANGPAITLRINGVESANYVEKDSKRPASGVIALQYHRPGENFEIRYRDIQIKILDAEKPATAAAGTLKAGKPVDLLPLINPARDGFKGTWALREGGLVGSGGDEKEGTRLDIPYVPPEEYDYRIEFTRPDDKETVVQLFPHGGKALVWAVGAHKNTACTFLPNKTVYAPNKGKFLIANRRHVSLVQVRKKSVKGYLDGTLILETGYEGLGDKNWSARDASHLGIGNKGATLYLKLELIPMTAQ